MHFTHRVLSASVGAFAGACATFGGVVGHDDWPDGRVERNIWDGWESADLDTLAASYHRDPVSDGGACTSNVSLAPLEAFWD